MVGWWLGAGTGPQPAFPSAWLGERLAEQRAGARGSLPVGRIARPFALNRFAGLSFGEQVAEMRSAQDGVAEVSGPFGLADVHGLLTTSLWDVLGGPAPMHRTGPSDSDPLQGVQRARFAMSRAFSGATADLEKGVTSLLRGPDPGRGATTTPETSPPVPMREAPMSRTAMALLAAPPPVLAMWPRTRAASTPAEAKEIGCSRTSRSRGRSARRAGCFRA